MGTALGTVFEENEGAAGETVILDASAPVDEQKEAAACETPIFQALLRRAALQLEGFGQADLTNMKLTQLFTRISATAWTVDTIGLVLETSLHDAAASIFETGLSGNVEEFIKTVATFEAVAATNSEIVMGKVPPSSPPSRPTLQLSVETI